MFHKEGHLIISISLVIAMASVLGIDYLALEPIWLSMSLKVMVLILLIMILQFFRNPKRRAALNHNHILSPVDGKVVVIEEVMETEVLGDQRKQVSIFMSPINVHVTRYPASGVVSYSKYHPGKYLVAWDPKSSTENERHSIVISNPKVTMLVKQIAGALARRIVNYAVPGEQAKQNEELGFIKFGSRVDLLLPVGTKVNVKLGDTVKNGISILATI